MSPPKTTPPRLHAEERRRQLLDAALNLFSQRGFEGTTTKEIAAAAGVTEAIVFRHFPSKLALYQAVLQSCHESPEMQEWLARAKACMDVGDDAGLLRTIADKILSGYRVDTRLHRVILFAALEGHDQALALNRQISLPVFMQLCQYIQGRQESGKLRNYDPRMILAAIAGMASHYGTLTQMFGYESHLPDDQVAEIFTSMLMNGILPPSNGIQQSTANKEASRI